MLHGSHASPFILAGHKSMLHGSQATPYILTVHGSMVYIVGHPIYCSCLTVHGLCSYSYVLIRTVFL